MLPKNKSKPLDFKPVKKEITMLALAHHATNSGADPHCGSTVGKYRREPNQ